MTSLSPFISREDLSDYLGRDVTADEGATIAIDSACDIVRTITEQDFNETSSGTVVLDGTGTDALVLPQLPVTDIESVTLGGTVLYGTVTGGTSVYNWLWNEDGLLYRTAGAAVTDFIQDETPSIWPAGRQNVKVVYSHGYGTAVMPRDVRMVALQIAARIVVQGVTVYESVGPVTARYGGPALDLSATEKAILRKYRK